jgi:hypothetical protein
MTDSQALEPTKPKKVRERPTYDPVQVERGLLALAECNGNGRKAERLLAEDGITISDSTLYLWKNGPHAEQYERIRAEVLPKVRLAASEDHMALSERCMEAEHLLLDRLVDEVPKLDRRDISTSLRNVSTSGAIHVDKGQVLSDAPTEIRRLDTGEVLRKLNSRGMRFEAVERKVVLEDSEQKA